MAEVKTVTLKLSEDVHRALKIRVATDSTTIQDYLLNLIIKDDMEKNPHKYKQK